MRKNKIRILHVAQAAGGVDRYIRIYLIMCGRLGNQLFQYAFARKVQQETGQDLAIDFTAIDQVGNAEWRNYLEDYQVSTYKIVKKNDYLPIQRVLYKIFRIIRPKNGLQKQYKFDEFIAKWFYKCGILFYESDYLCHKYDFSKIKTKNILIRGWFESEKYFEGMGEILRKEFLPQNPCADVDLVRKLKETESVCVTIRRGNFTETQYKDKFLVCGISFYHRAIEYMKRMHKPIIIHTIEYFENHPMIDAIALVCVADWIDYCKSLLYKFRIDKVKAIVPGGETGQLSIYNGLKAAKEIAGDEESIVLIHDGVRPLINDKVITDNINSVKEHGSAITTAVVKETILVVDPETSTIDYAS